MWGSVDPRGARRWIAHPEAGQDGLCDLVARQRGTWGSKERITELVDGADIRAQALDDLVPQVCCVEPDGLVAGAAHRLGSA